MIDTKLLKKRKKELGLSFDELAEKTGYSRRTIIGIINGETLYPRMETVQAIAKILYLNTEDISTPDIIIPEQTVSNEQYSEQEKELLTAFRALPDSRRRQFAIETIENLSKMDKTAAKDKSTKNSL